MKRVFEARSGLPTRCRAAAFRLGLGAVLLAVATTPALANTFNVNTSTDGDQDSSNTTTCAEVDATNTLTGKCSLRAAIMVGNGITANSVATAHIINISVPLITIQNGSFPTMQAEYVLNGNNATIDGNGLTCLNLSDSGTENPSASPPIHNGNGANDSTIQNLNIGNCNALAAIVANGHGYHFLNNHIGVGPDGATGVGLPPKMNQGHGIYLSASAAYASQFIDVAGLKSLYDALPAQPVDSIEINKFSVNIATALQNLDPDLVSGNVISNNTQDGIELTSENLGGTIITNNFIGTNSTGTLAVPNTGNGISFLGTTFGNLIGPGNVISGNGANGINVSDATVFLPNFIMGNFIGVNGTLGSHVGNALSGIVVDTSPDTSVGHFNPSQIALIIGPQNVISDNQGTNNILNPDDQNDTQAGIVITGSSTGIRVIGNRIGLNDSAPGVPSSSTLFGNQGDGIIVTTKGNKIGGSGATDGNVIAGNARHGIVVKSGATSNSILGNSIGADPSFAGNLGLGNGLDGIHIDNGNTTTIGGTGGTDFNTIAGNGRNGIKIRNGDLLSGWGNLSQRNLVYHNATSAVPIPGHLGVGIDLDYTEDATDAPHAELTGGAYANFDQASPVICTGTIADLGACIGSVAPASSGGSTSLQWTIATHGPANFRMEFFQIDTTDDNSATTMKFLGETTVSTALLTGLPVDSAQCSAGRCTSSITADAGGGYIVMSATDITPLTNTAGNLGDWKSTLVCFAGDIGIPLLSVCPVNNTSEFSAVATIPAAAPTVVTNPAAGVTGVAATLEGTVTANGADATVSFDYGPTTSYGTAVAGLPATVTAAQAGIGVAGSVSGLTCGNTYHYRAKATNSQGTTLGGDLSFATAPCVAAAPIATTLAATAISGSSATLNGLVTANGQTTTVKFGYGPTTAYGAAGSPANATQNPLSSGSSNAPVSLTLTGLSCNTLYHFQVTANSGSGGALGGDLTFTTALCSPIAPTVTTTAATAVTATTATINGTVTANGAITSVNFDFGLDNVAYGALGSPAAATPSTLTAGAVSAAVSVSLTGLTCATQYHFRANAHNGVGATVNGNDLTFTTSACVQAPPAVTTFAASSITLNSATFNGVVSANGASTTVNFDYGTSTSYGSSINAAPSPVSTNGATVTAAAASLFCSTTYHFRVVGTNSGGTTNGADQLFVTSPCPTPLATTTAATAITLTGATLNGTVSANGGSAIVTFEYGLTSSYTSTLAATQSPVSTNGAVVSVPVTGLTCGTPYHFRVDINNGAPGGTVFGNDQVFTTPACTVAPTATTGAASVITVNSATLGGTATANGAATTVSFDYGTTIGYGQSAAAAPLAAGSPANTPVSAAISGLACGTPYHFRVSVSNVNGNATGNDATFTTSACPVNAPTATTGAASVITVNSATLGGTATANGAATTVSFDYGTTIGYGQSAAAAPLAAGSPANTPVSAAISGLACGTPYHFRVSVSNVNGNATGNDATFTTSACPVNAPTATTGAASVITVNSATLGGTATANGAATTVSFDYGTTIGYGQSAAAAPLAAGSPANTPVSAAISGLACGTPYHFRVSVSNVNGNATGNDATFTTSACPVNAPTATTGAASVITVNSATLGGTATANGAATTVSFDYGTTIGYGQSAAAAPLAAGSPANTPVSAAISGLACGTPYHFRVSVSNVNGNATGNDATFTTSACPVNAPTATTGAASVITVNSATLGGTATANGAATTVSFDYGTTIGYGQSAAAAPLAAGSPANTPVSAAISGLACGMLYHFRVSVSNVNGNATGNDATFTTSACPVNAPTATTGAASVITVNSATLGGTATANGAATTVSFDYGTTIGYGQSAAAAPLAAGSPANTPVSAAISGLACGMLYHFRVSVSNVNGNATGNDATFTTSACPVNAPTATTGAASVITVNSATLGGTATANGAATTVSFDYGTTIGYGQSAAAAPLAAGSPANTPVSAAISGLACGTPYHFRVSVSNVNGNATGNDATFTTSACPVNAPTATTGAASVITVNSATLGGTATANGAATTVSFDYGTTIGYGQSAAAAPLAAGSPANTPVSAAIASLACGTLYHFRVNVSNVNGNATGNDATFTTSACPSVTTYSALTYTGTGFASVVLSGGGASCTLSNLAFVGPPAAPPAGYTFPDGLFQFSANNCVGTITVTVTFPTAFSGGEQYYKYGPTPGQLSPHWYTLGAGNSLTLVGNVATFTIADGGLGDDDLAINGTIVDQGGPAAPAAAPPEITPEAAPSLNLWGLLVLAGLLSLFGATQTRKRSH